MKTLALPFGTLLVALVGLLTGCSSASGSGGHTSVRITGHELEAIRTAAKGVFNEAGYAMVGSQPESMTFQRHGSLGDAVLFGGWGDDNITTRVRVTFESIDTTDWTLVATVYTVRDPGDRVLEEESRKIVVNRGPYTKLLKQVKERLEKPAAAGTTPP